MDPQRIERLAAFAAWVDDHTKQDSYDLPGGLFDAMNAPGKTPGGRYAGVDYFNGGLFRGPARRDDGPKRSTRSLSRGRDRGLAQL